MGNFGVGTGGGDGLENQHIKDESLNQSSRNQSKLHVWSLGLSSLFPQILHECKQLGRHLAQCGRHFVWVKHGYHSLGHCAIARQFSYRRYYLAFFLPLPKCRFELFSSVLEAL